MFTSPFKSSTSSKEQMVGTSRINSQDENEEEGCSTRRSQESIVDTFKQQASVTKVLNEFENLAIEIETIYHIRAGTSADETLELLYQGIEKIENRRKKIAELAIQLSSDYEHRERLNRELEFLNTEIDKKKMHLDKKLNSSWKLVGYEKALLELSRKGTENQNWGKDELPKALELSAKITTELAAELKFRRAILEKDEKIWGLEAKVQGLEKAEQIFWQESENILELQKLLHAKQHKGPNLRETAEPGPSCKISSTVEKEQIHSISQGESQQATGFDSVFQTLKNKFDKKKNLRFICFTCEKRWETEQELKQHKDLKGH